MAKVAFIGLGVMGYPMAGHLKRKGGHDVTVYNRTASKAANWAAEYGGFAAATPAGAADDADFVFTCVGNDDDLREVTIGPEGCIKAMKSGAVVVELMFNLARQNGTSVVMITHDAHLAERTDRTFTMEQGQLTETTSAR